MLHFQVTVVEVEREGAQFVQVEAYDARGIFRTFLAGERS